MNRRVYLISILVLSFISFIIGGESFARKQKMIYAAQNVFKKVKFSGTMNLFGKVGPFVVSQEVDEPIYLIGTNCNYTDGVTVEVSGILRYTPGFKSPVDDRPSVPSYYFINNNDLTVRQSN